MTADHQPITRKPVLDVHSLTVSYLGLLGRVDAVRDVSFQVYPGEAVAVVGESGSGKTTVAMAVMRLLSRRTACVGGAIHFDGRDLLAMSSRQMTDIRGRDMAMVFQDPMTSLNPFLTVGTQVAEPLRRHQHLSRKEAGRRVVELLTAMDVPRGADAFRRYPHQYSGGMRQRAMAAGAFSTGPKLLIADEPTTALDVITQAQILRLIRHRVDDMDMALLLITHDLGIVAGLCDRVVVMKDGEVVEQATVQQLYSSPTHPYTQSLLKAVPRIIAESAKRHGDASSQGESSAKGFGKRLFKGSPQPDPSANIPAIQADQVTVVFKRKEAGAGAAQDLRAVDGVSLDLMPGEVLGLVGQSGSGKLTLLRVIAGLTKPTSGNVRIFNQLLTGATPRDLHALRRQMQLVFQDPRASLNGRWTAERIIAEPLVNFGLANGRKARGMARSLMEEVNLDPSWGSRFPHEFSGGQCQRLAIARALAISPRILLCDEPVSALDVSVQAEILNLLAWLRLDRRLSILFVSHDLAVVRGLADRVAVMCRGRIVETGPTKVVYEQPMHEYTQRLLAAVPIPDPTLYQIGRRPTVA